MSITPTLIKELLQDIESSGKTRGELVLETLVSRKPDTYGEKASDKRRSIQKKFDLLKRKTPQAYLNYLDKFGVDPGEALKREIRLKNNQSIASASASEDIDFSGDDESTIPSVEESTEASTSSNPSIFAKVSTPPHEIVAKTPPIRTKVDS